MWEIYAQVSGRSWVKIPENKARSVINLSTDRNDVDTMLSRTVYINPPLSPTISPASSIFTQNKHNVFSKGCHRHLHHVRPHCQASVHLSPPLPLFHSYPHQQSPRASSPVLKPPEALPPSFSPSFSLSIPKDSYLTCALQGPRDSFRRHLKVSPCPSQAWLPRHRSR